MISRTMVSRLGGGEWGGRGGQLPSPEEEGKAPDLGRNRLRNGSVNYWRREEFRSISSSFAFVQESDKNHKHNFLVKIISYPLC